MKFLKQPVIALILCLVVCFVSGVLSTRIQISNELNSCTDSSKRAALIEELKTDRSQFPGNVFIGCSGLALDE